MYGVGCLNQNTMKVERQKDTFKPVVITIETIEELRLLAVVLNESHSKLLDRAGSMYLTGLPSKTEHLAMYNQIHKLL
jgi:hypothetical protein